MICVLVIIINASWNTISRASPVMHHVFWISFVAIFVGTALPLAARLLLARLSLQLTKSFQSEECWRIMA